MKVLNLGEIDYKNAYDIQLAHVAKVFAGEDETLIVCSHPSVVTLGKKSTPLDLQGWQGSVYEIERGAEFRIFGLGA